ncbi:hypothetical protein N9D31_04100, partial [Oligoflexaceae bacterium]|nr:hypothetical protein [Oligoflexaceae bacterium]
MDLFKKFNFSLGGGNTFSSKVTGANIIVTVGLMLFVSSAMISGEEQEQAKSFDFGLSPIGFNPLPGYGADISWRYKPSESVALRYHRSSHSYYFASLKT